MRVTFWVFRKVQRFWVPTHHGLAKRSFAVLALPSFGRKQTSINAIFVDDEPSPELPLALPQETRLTVCTDRVLCLLKPLHLPDLLQAPAIDLRTRQGDLVCEIYHYRANNSKRFWDLQWPGAFYKGRPACIFFLAVYARRPMPMAEDVRDRWSSLTFDCVVEPPETRTHLLESRRGTATVSGSDGVLSLDIDLMDFRHWPGNQAYLGLDAPLVAQRNWQEVAETRVLPVADAEIEMSNANVLFARQPDTGDWVLVQTADNPGPIRVRSGDREQLVPLAGKGIATFVKQNLTVHQVNSSNT